MSPNGTKLLCICLYVLYMVILVFPSLEPGLYNACIDTLEFLVTEIFSFALVMYHNSIPMSHKTILNYLMKKIATAYCGIYLFHWLTSLFFNTFSSGGLLLLQTNPSLTCFILSADIFHFTFLSNVTLIIILHACFTANPRLFLEFNDYYLKILVYGYNFVCLVVIAYGKWTISFCSKSFIYKISEC